MMKKYMKHMMIGTTLILLVHFILIYNIIEKKQPDLNLIYYAFATLRIILATNCVFILISFKIKQLYLGISFVVVAYLLEFLNSYILVSKDTSILLSILFIVNTVGYVLIIYGIIIVLKNMNHLNTNLSNLAYFDRLTSLPNRNYLMSLCHPTSTKTSDSNINCDFITNNKMSAFLFLDIDDFKLINDYMGHFGGDAVLKEVALRLKSFFNTNDIVFRISGDEFLIIIKNLDTIKQIDSSIQMLLNYLNQPILVKDKELNITTSIGIAYYPKHGIDLETLMKNADIAMYEAKRMGKNNYYIFNDALEAEFTKRYEIIFEIKNAIKNNEFIIHYQPKASVLNGEITGLEALIRWVHPTKGLIYPNHFIQIAEEVGLIDKIDMTVISEVSKQLAKWQLEGKKLYNISINISPQFFLNKDFIPIIDEIFSQHQFDLSYISFEITENIALHDFVLTKSILEKLKQRNLKIYIDDFGKGYSSINYIKEFKFDYLKIDKSFIDSINTNKVDQAIIQLIINLSKLKGFKIISEGVETVEQLDFLFNIGCHEYQGFLLSRPQPIEDLNNFIK